MLPVKKTNPRKERERDRDAVERKFKAERRKRKKREGKKKKQRSEGSEIWEAAGIFFVVVRDGENGLVEFVVAELLKRDGGRDGGKHGDVCRRDRRTERSG